MFCSSLTWESAAAEATRLHEVMGICNLNYKNDKYYLPFLGGKVAQKSSTTFA